MLRGGDLKGTKLRQEPSRGRGQAKGNHTITGRQAIVGGFSYNENTYDGRPSHVIVRPSMIKA